MSKLQELIQKLCPNGVEYKKLETVCELSRGKVYSKTYITANAGDYPVYSSQTANNGELGRISTYDYDGEYLTWTTDGAYAGTIFHRKGKFCITNVCGLIAVKSPDILNIRFLYYWLSIKAQDYVYRGMGNPKLMSNQIAPIEIPIPPLEVQEEIVRILDNFTNLAAELQAELQARQEQYEYYRNKLLTFNELKGVGQSVTWMKMSEIFEMKNGYTPSKAVTEYWENGIIPWFRMEDIRKNGRILSDSILHITPQAVKGGKLFHANSIILATTATIGEHALIIADSLANQRFTNLSIRKSLSNALDMKYFYYYMFVIDDWCRNNTNVSGFASVDMRKLKNLLIPIPPLAEQKRIVSILDKFDALVNDLSRGLPAEIAAVQEQYEYYRNKLLSFPRTKISA